MNRRQALLPLMASLAGQGISAPDSGSKKKGWGGGDAKLHELFGAHWYYTWSPKTRPSKKIEFVPMMKGAWSLKQVQAVQQMQGITSLLGFNEPSRKKQGNLSIDEAVKLWPKLSKLATKKGIRLGSPAPTSDDAGMAWHTEFMARAKKQDLKVDFVAVHWYRSRNSDQFEAFIDKLAKEYRLPIWVTEFNGWTGPEDENFEFLKDSLRFLERHRSVERYAYFNPGKGKPHSLVNADGSLTRMGKLYRDT